MGCPLCKGRMSQGTTVLPFVSRKGGVIVVLDVPARVCDQCGEAFVDLEVAGTVERLLRSLEQNGVSMGFVEYGKAA